MGVERLNALNSRDITTGETDLIGTWVERNGHLECDTTTSRINWLIHERLERIGSDNSGWYTLFRDPQDGRLWELTYPRSEMHGGGPPRLTAIDPVDASEKYKL